MNKKEKLALASRLLAFSQVVKPFSKEEYMLEEIIFLNNKKVMDMSIRMILEIRELINEGYLEDEIIEMIENIEFHKEDNFTNEEKEFLKKDAIKSLKRIITNQNKGEDIYE